MEICIFAPEEVVQWVLTFEDVVLIFCAIMLPHGYDPCLLAIESLEGAQRRDIFARVTQVCFGQNEARTTSDLLACYMHVSARQLFVFKNGGKERAACGNPGY